MRRLLPPLAYTALALVLLQPALGPGLVPGVSNSEAWGRLFVPIQVGRWLSGAAPPLQADLLNWPDGQPFWPIDPVVQLVQAPLALLLGDAAALTVVAVVLLTLAGLGPFLLARAAGAEPAGAFAGGLVVLLAPFVLRNLHDAVLEVVAIGLLALAARAILLAHHHPGPRSLILTGLWIGILAGTSPYFAVFLALAAGIAAVFTLPRWRRWLQVGAVGALACGLLAAPLVATEGGEHGRLGPHFAEGYSIRPGALVRTDGSPVAVAPGELPGPRTEAPAAPRRDPGPPPRWMQVLHRFPGGLTVMVALLFGLGSRRSRWWSVLGLVVFMAGPGPHLASRALRLGAAPPGGLLEMTLAALPLVDRLGNPSRVLAVVLVAAAIAGSLAARRWWLALTLGALAVAEAALGLTAFRLPATPVDADDAVLAELTGPTIVFPSGDPPCWNPTVGPKEALYLAARAGAPSAYDYGRTRLPADLQAQVWLAHHAGTPVGSRALSEAGPIPESLPNRGFSHLLVLEDRLTDAEVEGLDAALTESADLLRRGEGMSAWRLGVP